MNGTTERTGITLQQHGNWNFSHNERHERGKVHAVPSGKKPKKRRPSNEGLPGRELFCQFPSGQLNKYHTCKVLTNGGGRLTFGKFMGHVCAASLGDFNGGPLGGR